MAFLRSGRAYLSIDTHFRLFITYNFRDRSLISFFFFSFFLAIRFFFHVQLCYRGTESNKIPMSSQPPFHHPKCSCWEKEM